MLLSSKDWYDKYYNDYNYEDYCNDCDIEGKEVVIDEDEFINSQYEAYCGEAQDIAYEEYKDRKYE